MELMGCITSGTGKDPKPRPLDVKTRMEIVENPDSPDSLVDLFMAATISHTVPGTTYTVRGSIEDRENAHVNVFGDIHAAADTVLQLSWTFHLVIAEINGDLLRAEIFIDDVPLARDSVSYP